MRTNTKSCGHVADILRHYSTSKHVIWSLQPPYADLIIFFYYRIVFGKVRQLVGGRVRLILSGGAPLSPDTHEQIRNVLCANVVQGYGLTETTSCATVSDGN